LIATQVSAAVPGERLDEGCAGAADSSAQVALS